jgi:hypothetical protein
MSGRFVDPTSFSGLSGTQVFTDNTRMVYGISAAQNNTLLFNSTAASYYDNQQALALQPSYPVPPDGSTINIDIPDHMLSSALSPSNQRPQATGTNTVSKPQALVPYGYQAPIALAAQPVYRQPVAAPAPFSPSLSQRVLVFLLRLLFARSHITLRRSIALYASNDI